MQKPMFSELEKPEATDLIGLRVVKIVASLHDSLQRIELEDEKGGLHEVTFQLVDASYIAVKLDGSEVLSLETEV